MIKDFDKFSNVTDIFRKKVVAALEEGGVQPKEILDALMCCAGMYALERDLMAEYALANTTNAIIHSQGKDGLPDLTALVRRMQEEDRDK